MEEELVYITFDFIWNLTAFVNEHRIAKDDIEAITQDTRKTNKWYLVYWSAK